jgi:hypothetical protein
MLPFWILPWVTVITTAFLIRHSLWGVDSADCCADKGNESSPRAAIENILTALRLMSTPHFRKDSLGILRGCVQHRQSATLLSMDNLKRESMMILAWDTL